ARPQARRRPSPPPRRARMTESDGEGGPPVAAPAWPRLKKEETP
ncbi:hypothetical protein HMPREF0731_1368, partial [Pseudoroseomonas cervicalis ATCC 49957]